MKLKLMLNKLAQDPPLAKGKAQIWTYAIFLFFFNMDYF